MLDQASIAFENSHHLARLARRLQREEVLATAADSLRNSTSLAAAPSTAAEQARLVLGRPAFAGTQRGVQGWPALLSACLAFLDMTKHSVIGESFEHTLAVFSSALPHRHLAHHIHKFPLDWPLLDDLERAYYMQ